MSEEREPRNARDVVLVTVDAWRADAVADMPALRAMAEDGAYERSTAVSHSASTNGAFPPLLASQHLVQAYDPDGLVRSGTRSLPAILGEQGYATGGVVASNPFLAKWDGHFDHFWNDGMTTEMDLAGPRYSVFDRAQRLVRLKQRVNATDVATRARRWYRRQGGPRFLWVHLMDLHGPYFTGVRKAREVGLYETYRTLVDYHVRDRCTPSILATLRELYDRCVKRLDERLSTVLEFVDDEAVVVVTGDHGEEFGHGYHGHAQLYDECVMTPLFTRNLDRPVTESNVRHIDLAPTILRELGLSVPDNWEGEPVDGTSRRAILLNHSPLHERSYAGVRTDRHKFIRSYHDERWTVENRELYDLRTDPEESTSVEDPEAMTDLESTVDAFLARSDVDLDVIRERKTGLDDDVEDRLEELGYV